MLKGTKLSTKLAGGFGVMMALAVVLGGVAWFTFSHVQREVAAADAAAACQNLMLDARRHEKNVIIRGHAKDAASGKTSADQWRETFATLQDELGRLHGLPALSAAQRNDVQKAQSDARDYGSAFEVLSQSRSQRDAAFAGWADVGWKINAEVGKASDTVIDPAREQARQSGDTAGEATWAAIAIGLHTDVIEPFLMMRLTGAFLGVQNNEAAWQGYSERADAAMISLARWADQTKEHAALQAAAEQIRGFLTQHRGFGQQYWDAVVAADQADARIVAAARAIGDACDALATTKRNEAAAAVASAAWWLGGVTLAALVLGVILNIGLTRAITGPLNRIINGLRDGAAQVSDAAGQVASTSQMLAAGASEQASSLEESSAALEQMASTIRTSAASAREADKLSQVARTAAQSGDVTMGRLNEAMSAINQSSSEVAKIIKVIEEIAFQTNLLALNAAVEAARAGEHGKGFAVVAEEVRNLARRAAEAAGRTTNLITESVDSVRSGTQVAGEVGQALAGIVGDVSKVSELINSIAQASEEQAQGIEQVNMAVSQMDKVTQQNAAGAEESASAAEEMSAQAEHVAGMVRELAGLIHGAAASQTGPVNRASHPAPTAYKPAPPRPGKLTPPPAPKAPAAPAPTSAGDLDF